jgi:ABC-type phosphate transport system substrate-binding protein
MKRIFILIAALFAVSSASVRAADAVFIVNPDVKDTQLSVADIRSVLLGNKNKWDGAGVIKLAVLTAGPAHEHVMQVYAQRSADQFDKFWKKIVFTGKGSMPAQFADEASLVDYVAKTPGAIGYVSAGAVTPQVKALAVQ